MREKLIELLAEFCSYKKKKCVGCDPGKHYHPECKTEQFGWVADHLIANGVTIQKWIPVTERLPEEDGEYITMTNAKGKWGGVLAQKYRTSCVRGEKLRRWYWLERLSPWEVTHWMPLPEPPKEGVTDG